MFGRLALRGAWVWAPLLVEGSAGWTGDCSSQSTCPAPRPSCRCWRIALGSSPLCSVLFLQVGMLMCSKRSTVVSAKCKREGWGLGRVMCSRESMSNEGS
jgi:hypothetical protein